MYERAPPSAMAEMNAIAAAKPPYLTITPITKGVIVPPRFPQKLKTPPVRPSSRLGAIRDTSTQVIEANPLPKNATVRKNITQPGLSTKLAPTTHVDRSIPPMIGPFLATEADTPRRVR